ncbi:alpha/beta hydrolase fold domain-containing protein [Pseudooceanicola sp. C21-150M6]|uniref:alpha/beta hydrolase fold domain-containing protein n=1 Tax=Pseudooceanicola sp. C21-150M6 TaxID=3434355 RepID=UPI003D7FEB0A
MGQTSGQPGSEAPGGDATRRNWKQDPDAVQANILDVARRVFAEDGFSGARVDEIARRTATSKRMIYYYYGDKEGLYRAVLEDAYRKIRMSEDALDLAGVPPIEALRQLAEVTFDHHRRNTDFIRIVMIENVHEARHMSRSHQIAAKNSSAIRHLEDIYRRGCQQGLFRRGLTALELHWHISAMCYFNVSNRSTFSLIFGEDLFGEMGQQKLRRHVGDMIVRFVLRGGVGLEEGPQRAPADTRPSDRAIHPDIFRFLEVWDGKWAGLPPDATGEDRRMRFESIARDMRMPTPAGVETDEEHWIETPGGPVRVRIFRPVAAGPGPAMIYMHGGAWIQGSPETHWDITARIAAWSGLTVISVDYDLAPESPYPAAFNQCCGVLDWALREAGMLNIDPARISVGGDSAGGNLAAALAIRARDIGVKLRAQLLITPLCDFDRTRPSCQENAEGPLLKLAALRQAEEWYCPDEALRASDPSLAPLVAKDHAGLAPAFVATAQYDPLRDSGTLYADALKAAGVPVAFDPGTGLIHGYLRALEYCDEAGARLQAICDWLRETAT